MNYLHDPAPRLAPCPECKKNVQWLRLVWHRNEKWAWTLSPYEELAPYAKPLLSLEARDGPCRESFDQVVRSAKSGSMTWIDICAECGLMVTIGKQSESIAMLPSIIKSRGIIYMEDPCAN